MPRRKKQPQIQDIAPLMPIEESWWSIYLKDILGLIKTAEAMGKQVVIDTETEETLKDPLFTKYLKYGPGKAGGPSTISEFLSLPPDQRKFYLNIYKDWKQVVKREGIDKKLLTME